MFYHPKTFAVETPDKPAYVLAQTGEAVTFKELDERANRLAHLFRGAGLGVGDHIAILMENNAHYFVAALAAQRSGLYYTAISTHLTTNEVEYIVNDCEAKLFFTSYAMKDLARVLLDKTPNVETRLMANGAIAGYESFEQRAAEYPITPIADECQGRDMLYSSGTTGRPKGIVPPDLGQPLEEGNEELLVYGNLYGLDQNTVYLSPAPLYHAAPLRFCMIMMRFGGTVAVMEKFDAVEFLAMVEKYRITHTQVVPTMFIRMLKLDEEIRKKFDLSSLKLIIHAAAPCPIPIKEKMIEWLGPIIYEYYAGSEGNGFVSINSEEWLKHKGSVGRGLKGTVHILDENENELPPGEPGLIYIADGTPFTYHNDPEKTAASQSSKGWTTLGDIGYLDEEGYLYLTDRKDNMIISGGVNIYPQEAENVMIMHPKVKDVAVFGVPNEEFGEEVKAVVQPVDTAEAGPALEQELIAFCHQSLSKIKCPKSVEFEENMPRTPTGKLIKRLLKERYWKNVKKAGN
ncbi:MAG: AMP-binding protein [Deltaproteobacteria bacterium]|nr:AMP-binding protein [Deltaproteobacteria bacterium]MBW2052960.1 AMP-binding protein [Deltaproteobacteria bacterium]MBW2141553.1 AMP-binding protein [Deltaproteobacteria bacterium]